MQPFQNTESKLRTTQKMVLADFLAFPDPAPSDVLQSDSLSADSNEGRHRDEFARHYHKRSNVESTFSMIKAKFRDHVRSKTDVAMVNEVLCKIICHNICCLIQESHELGIKSEFLSLN